MKEPVDARWSHRTVIVTGGGGRLPTGVKTIISIAGPAGDRGCGGTESLLSVLPCPSTRKASSLTCHRRGYRGKNEWEEKPVYRTLVLTSSNLWTAIRRWVSPRLGVEKRRRGWTKISSTNLMIKSGGGRTIKGSDGCVGILLSRSSQGKRQGPGNKGVSKLGETGRKSTVPRFF